MNFGVALKYTATTPDPRATPDTVPEQYIFTVTPNPNSSPDVPVTAMLAALEGTAADTATFELWALDEPFNPPGIFPQVPQAAAERRFYKLVAATAVIVGNTLLLTPAYPGRVYLRCTVAPTAEVTVKLAPSPKV